MRPIWDNLRGRLILLVSLGMLPTLGLLLFAILQARQGVYTGVETEARRVRQLVALGQENLIEGVRLVLVTLAETPQVRAGGAACDDLLRDVLAQAPPYSDLRVVGLDGQVTCSPRPAARGPSARGRPWFELAAATGRFAVGEYELSPVTGQPVIVLAHPVRDAAGRLAGVVAAELPLARLAEAAEAIAAPAGATIINFDRAGTVLTRYPDLEHLAGQRLPDRPLVQAVLSGENTAAELAGLDGVRRVYAFRPLGRDQPLGLFLAAGVSREMALAEFDGRVLRYGSVIIGLTLLTLGLAYLTGIQLVLRPVEALARGFRRLRGGDLAARVRLGDNRTDLGALGHDFNAMAAALETREAERRQTEDRLRLSEQRYRTLFTHGGMCAAVFDDEGRFVEANAACAEMLGYAPDELPGLSLWDVTPEAEREASQSAWSGWHQAGDHSGAYAFRRRDGGLAYVDYHAAHHVMPGYHLWMMRDITERLRAERANQVLAEAGRALEASLDAGARLRGLLAAVTPALADWSAAHLVSPEGPPALEGAAHADPAQLPRLEELLRQHPLDSADGAEAAAEPARALHTGQLVFHPRLDPAAPPGERPHWPPLRALAVTGLVAVPLLARGRTLGVLTLARLGRDHPFVWADAALALELGRRAALALDNARLFDEAQTLNVQLEQRVAARTQQLRQSLDEVQASREALRQLSRRLQTAREEERRRIAREIHDELGGALTGLKMDAVALRRGLEAEQAALAARAAAMADLIDATIQTVRRLATELRPSMLDDLGLVAALEWLAADFETRTGLPVTFASNVEHVDLDAERAIALYRTAQESLTNVARHAQASAVELRLTRDEHGLHLLVADDGRGITPDEIGRPGSSGLVGMRERLASVEGELTIAGRPGQGTRISARLKL